MSHVVKEGMHLKKCFRVLEEHVEKLVTKALEYCKILYRVRG